MLATVLSTLRDQGVNLFIEKFVQASNKTNLDFKKIILKRRISQRNFHKNRSNFNSISGAQNRLFSGEKNWGVKTCVAVPLMLCKSLRKVNKQTWQCTSIEENEDFNPIFWF